MDKYDYPTLVMEKAYCEMEDEELEFCKGVEAEYYLPKIRQMQNEKYSNVFICSCIQDLYADYLIYDDYDLGIRAGMSLNDIYLGEVKYRTNDNFDYETDNPLRD